MTVACVDGFYHHQRIAPKTFDSPGTDEVFSTRGGIHHMEGSGGGLSWSFKVNQPSVRGESKLIELGHDAAHFTVKAIMAPNQQRRMATIGVHLPKFGRLEIVRPAAYCGSSNGFNIDYPLAVWRGQRLSSGRERSQH
jgi:hypothetical protein